MSGDDRLVEHIRRGDELAFEVAFERHSPAILSFCRHMLGSREEAEDAVQQAFASAYRALGRGEREIKLKPWLFAIARNRCLSMLRARRERAVESAEIATAGLAEQVESRGELRDLLQDLEDLPEQQREALLMSELSGLSHAEIGGVLDCDPAKVKALVFRARSGLIERRDAREAPCLEIREQLANLRGGSLRRGRLRHHLRVCEGCREYRERVKQQRSMLAAVLPVTPTFGLKESVLGAIGIGGGSAGGALAVGGGALVAKVATVCVLAGGAGVAGERAIDGASDPGRSARAPSAQAQGGTPAGATATSRPAAPSGLGRRAATPVRAPTPVGKRSRKHAKRSPGQPKKRRNGDAAADRSRSEEAHARNEQRAAERAKDRPARPGKPDTAAQPGYAGDTGRGARPAKPENLAERAKPDPLSTREQTPALLKRLTDEGTRAAKEK